MILPPIEDLYGSASIPPWALDADTCLALEDGRVFWGHGFGSPIDVDGEVVFNTSMAGYQEIATDPSYHGQMVVLTHPQVGNYGVQLEASESMRPWIAALIVRDLASSPNHWLASGRLDELLAAAGVPGVAGIDTRALTRHLRTHGTMRAALCHIDGAGSRGTSSGGAGSGGASLFVAHARRTVERAREAIPLSAKQLVADVSDPVGVGQRTERAVEASRVAPLRIALLDLGAKHNIARSLSARGATVVPVPWDAAVEAIRETGSQGVVLSNGPGDPERMDRAAALAKQLWQQAIPTLGICLGHQVFGLAAGGTTSRLKFGHHGGNHPVKDVLSGRIHITSQNHEFQVDGTSIAPGTGFFVSAFNLNDHSVEGLGHRELPVFSVQYHPEGCPGPEDNQVIFDRFLAMVDKKISGAEALGLALDSARRPIRQWL